MSCFVAIGSQCNSQGRPGKSHSNVVKMYRGPVGEDEGGAEIVPEELDAGAPSRRRSHSLGVVKWVPKTKKQLCDDHDNALYRDERYSRMLDIGTRQEAERGSSSLWSST